MPPDGVDEAIARGTGTALEAPLVLREHRVRVRYDGADLADVGAAARLSTAEVVAVHSGRVYEVASVGFLPGFAYLGGGWHLLGTAVDFAPFDARAGADMSLGDRVRFVAETTVEIS